MAWKKHFQSIPTTRQLTAKAISNADLSPQPNSYSNRFSSWLPEVYTGQPNRIERYSQYDNMDIDVEVNMALDTITDSCVQLDEKSKLPFVIEWNDGITAEDTELLKEMLRQWVSINNFEKTAWRAFRSVLKYGDQFFIRDPDSYKLFWVDPAKVDSVVIDESKGKEPYEYIIRDLDANLQTLVATGNLKRPADQRGYSSGPLASGQAGGASYGTAPVQTGTRFNSAQTGGPGGSGGLAYHVNANNVVHVSLSEGMDNVWPFGISILENVFKTFKQKELIEDAVIIYRVQRAPERRVFYVDVGKMPNHRAMAYLERIKNEIQQKRIPSRTGGQNNIIDATYNPMSMLEDYFFAQNCLSLQTEVALLDGRTLTLKEIIKEYEEGKENWVYTINQKTHKMEPGKIKWAGITRKNAQVLKITLDNNKFIIATPDHKFIMRDGTEVEAQNLKINDSLMPLYRKYSKISKNSGIYEYILNDNKWELTHRIVGNYIKNEMVYDKKYINENKNLIHHKDFNSLNNNPNNLVKMVFKDHTKLHYDLGTKFGFGYNKSARLKGTIAAKNKLLYLKQYCPDEYKKFVNKRAQSQKKWRESLTREQWNEINKKRSISNKKFLEDPEKYKIVVKNAMRGLEIARQKLINNPELELERRRKISEAQKRRKIENPEYAAEISRKRSESLIKAWAKRKTEYKNHKVISIEWLDQKEDTGDLTIESKSDNHNFALTAGVYVHNSDGKGSRVETLPGGDQLGEIDDLKYFNHKLRTGLRVPRSYMPDFDDGGGAIFNDGRVGTAYIEELRFTKYCMRLQNLIIPNFDLEFKLFCKHRGINVHDSLFNLKFAEPQNFSKYRQTEVDSAVLNVYTQVADIPHISRQYGLKRYLGWTDDEIFENEKLWAEENAEKIRAANAGEIVPVGDEGTGFGDVGASAIGTPNFGNEQLGNEDIGNEEPSGLEGTESPISGNENQNNAEPNVEDEL